MHDRLLRFAAILLLCSLPAVAHAEFIDYAGNLLVKGLLIVVFVIAVIAILISLLSSRSNTPDSPPSNKQWPPKE